MGLREDYFNLALIIYAIVNAINDPILAVMSDRTDRKRWGSRRIIYIRWGGIIWAIIFILTWFPIDPTNDISLFFHFLLSYCMFDMGLTLVVGCWMALMPEVATDVNDRLKLTYITGVISMIFGGIVVVIFSLILDESLQLFQLMNIVVAVFCMILFFLVGILCHEREEFKEDKPLPFFEGIKETIKNKSFMIFIGYNFFNVTGFSLGIAYLFIYELIMPVNVLIFYAITIFNTIIGNFTGMKLRSKWGIRKTVLRFGPMKVIMGVTFFIFAITINNGLLILFGHFIMNFMGSIYSGYNHTLQTLSMDEDELKTGVRRENTFLGVNALFTKPGDSLGPIIATVILSITNYITEAEMPVGTTLDQPDTALFGIKIILFIVPAILTLCSMVFMYFYPIHGDYMEKMYEDLEELHRVKRENAMKLKDNDIS